MSADDAERRIRELEAEVRRWKFLAESNQSAALELARQQFPYEPLTEEEAQRLMTETDGTPLAELIAELERELK